MTLALNYKVVLIGEWGVGKTSLARNFIKEKYEEDYLPTIGSNVLVQRVPFDYEGNQFEILLSIWDIAGQKKFEKMRPMFYYGARGAFLVGDLTRKESFENLRKWQGEFLQYCDRSSAPTIILANKCDLVPNLDDQELSELGQRINNTPIFRTSALTGENVEQAFSFLAREIFMSNIRP